MKHNRVLAIPTLTSLLSEFTQQDGKTFACDKRDRVITCVFCRDLHLTLIFSGRLQNKNCLKKGEVCGGNESIVTLVTQSLSSSFLSRTDAFCRCATGSLKQKNYRGFRVSATQTNRTYGGPDVIMGKRSFEVTFKYDLVNILAS